VAKRGGDHRGARLSGKPGPRRHRLLPSTTSRELGQGHRRGDWTSAAIMSDGSTTYRKASSAFFPGDQ
jgi:hypothetical protein